MSKSPEAIRENILDTFELVPSNLVLQLVKEHELAPQISDEENSKKLQDRFPDEIRKAVEWQSNGLVSRSEAIPNTELYAEKAKIIAELTQAAKVKLDTLPTDGTAFKERIEAHRVYNFMKLVSLMKLNLIPDDRLEYQPTTNDKIIGSDGTNEITLIKTITNQITNGRSNRNQIITKYSSTNPTLNPLSEKIFTTAEPLLSAVNRMARVRLAARTSNVRTN